MTTKKILSIENLRDDLQSLSGHTVALNAVADHFETHFSGKFCGADALDDSQVQFLFARNEGPAFPSSPDALLAPASLETGDMAFTVRHDAFRGGEYVDEDKRCTLTTWWATNPDRNGCEETFTVSLQVEWEETR
jgi:hypothetical protein